MSAVEQAAEVIRGADGNPDVYRHAAQALADARLLVTVEMRAVLDAAEAVRNAKFHNWQMLGRALDAAVDAYLASQQGENP